ncbi:Na+/H+ antiporter subunit E [Pseudochelatococcus contaminans]|uniref:Multicomponent Na+:H+ antiporter subunit E n=1 Tax=Pseudochelatococcus contaminans TaxID=1538103 RepID=A0A7W5Z4L6_9HYPH|nr:Na+/H+ antiporter subunit E [Pseudochelatococcus contaminans]MBB3810098.1 multicomponent Na+:H+ antiporter subunit E [Pseudochelatococcus contaminans]
MSALLAWLRLTGLFFRDLALSVKDVAITVIDPHRPIHSAILAVPLDVKSDAGITLLANMITLTPGTTSLHVSEDRKTLYCHVLNASDQSVADIKNGFERCVKEVLS